MIKSPIFAGESENYLDEARQTNNILWGCRKNRKGDDLVTAIDTIYGVEK
jgi:hypothetical protein